MSSGGETLLSVEGLEVRFNTSRGVVRAVDGVSLTVAEGEFLGVVGESGCGKTMTSLAIMGLTPHGAEVKGRIRLGGTDLLGLSESELATVRGSRVAMVFQDPMAALDPVFTIGSQLKETLLVHRGGSRRAARAEAIELLTAVGIPSPERRMAAYPHQLSGGMLQRVMIALALAGRPGLVIADEPTTALDVTIQAQILELLARLGRERGMSILLITHDLGVVARMADRIAVMYAGRVVEEAPSDEVFYSPAHPYTRALLRSLIRLDLPTAEVSSIPGAPPSLSASPKGCSFAPRCDRARPLCEEEAPPEIRVAPTHTARCHFAVEVAANE